ncbi:Acetyltransferase (GNAT) domain-containing protein [Flaviramulus basaltis]|uniref:Acetyltransferase (GNAT) domain-containing protein n=2 Tax=Flaviramulus basaltis TaxID=369401 RepID=A0A1K2IMS8_9FLAO|nr:Acetyltransferase (GNAT) domain-containing protein [Flaviramulus basaltis]
MAILKEYQGKGIGNIILNYTEEFIKKKNTDIIWCNAREIAVDFYKKNNYQTIGKAFPIKDIGLHYVMYKTLKK